MPKRAFLLVRDKLHYRRDAFAAGLKRLGYAIDAGVGSALDRAGAGDVVVTWNRYGVNHMACTRAEQRGALVLVTENGYLGEDMPGPDKWFALSVGHHNGRGRWVEGGPERWDRLGVRLKPWHGPGEAVVLPQRGIGPPGVAMPGDWLSKHRRMGRVRHHPHGRAGRVALEADLKRAGTVITWGSGAAIRALTYGVPVLYGLPGWIMAGACAMIGEVPVLDDDKRLAAFRRMAWAMAPLSEIESGEAIDRLRGAL